MNFDFNLTDFFKLPTKIMAAISIATGLIIFLPNAIVKKMYLTTLQNNYGFIIGLVFLISFSIFSVSLVVSTYKYYISKRARKRFIAEGNNRLRKLDTYKKAIVYMLYLEDNHTGELPLYDGAVSILEQNLIIGKAATQYMVEDLNNAVFPYMLQPWVIGEFEKDSGLESIFEQAAKNQFEKEKASMSRVHKENNFYSGNRTFW